MEGLDAGSVRWEELPFEEVVFPAMPLDPFVILGISQRATSAQARAAYRRLALKHHPDHNPGDLAAAGRFKRILRAYRTIASGRFHRHAPPSTPPPAPRPDRYGCGSCGDTFPFPESCPRCGVCLSDRSAGPPPAPVRPDVEAMIAELLARPEIGADWDERLPVPGLLVVGCLMAALLMWQVGPLGPALLFAGFAAYIAGIETHRRVSDLQFD